jgi:hypothetical protein
MTDWAKKSLTELMAEGDLRFVAPLRFQFAQSSDETGEYYVREAKFIDAKGSVIMDVACNGDWCDVQMHAIAALLNAITDESGGEITKIVSECMEDAWNEICADTDCHPLDIKQMGRRRLEFSPQHWARLTGMRVAAALGNRSATAVDGVPE